MKGDIVIHRLLIPGLLLVPALLVAPTTMVEPAAAPDPATQDDAAPSTGDLPDVTLTPAFPRLSFARPVYLTHAGDDSGRLFVLEQDGRIRVFEAKPDVEAAGVFLDIKERVYRGHNEEGLLALAFHPRFRENRQFYVYYSASRPRRGVLSRFTVSADDPDRADPATEQVILEVDQPWGNHNGSTVLFGPDGYLYMSLGDGGAANDPQNNGQNLSTLLGTIVRIDVDRADPGRAYAIPPDNPFVDRDGARPEIWAWGLRNVWRMSFDPETGDLWAGEVGQNRWEEICLITRGGNYGWRIREGTHGFTDETTTETLIDPVVEYSHSEGLSVTGGHVYRGTRLRRLAGAYVYADYVSGNIWALRYEDGQVTAQRQIAKTRPRKYISSFGEGPDGELYVCAFNTLDARGSGGKGRIYVLQEQ
ncbi:MAG: PQQ-dependent sugar dehydrogenase [Planctomycetota bacterium]